MADTKVSAMTALTGANVATTDLLPIIDVSATTAGSKKITIAEFVDYLDSVLQPIDSDLTAIAALSTTAFGRGLLTETDAASTRSTLGLVIGTDVQAQGATLTSLEGLSLAAGDILYATAADTLARLAVGTDTHVLTLASGVPTWAAPSGGSGTPGGADTQVQFNDGGSFGGDAGLVFNKTTNALTGTGLWTVTQGSANTGVFASTGYSLTGTDATNMIDLAGTWNTTGTPTALKVNITSTASNAASKLFDFQVGGSSYFNLQRAAAQFGAALFLMADDAQFGWTGGARFSNAQAADQIEFQNAANNSLATLSSAGFRVFSTAYLGFSDSGNSYSTIDVKLFRDAAATLAQRNSTTAQTHRIYNTWTDASNGEWLEFGFATNVPYIRANKNGTGTDRALFLGPSANGWSISTAGFLIPSTASQDITGVRNLYATKHAFGASQSWIQASADGVHLLLNNAENNYGRLQFGGSTSSFPSIKRSSTAIHIRLADDSAYAPLSAELVTVAAGTATPANGSTAARLLFGTTAGFGIYYGSGAPSVSAAQGSLYLRSDGSSTSKRTYINTDGGTTWTAVTTAA